VAYLLLALSQVLGSSPHFVTGAREAPTFCRDVAPILFARCAPCHRPGGSAPFALLDFEETARHGRQIVAATRKRVMPPWLPVPGHGEFAQERRLGDGEIATLARWVEAGMPRGDPAQLPPAPSFPDGWQLGTPDLVVAMAEPFPVPAEGRDLLRNFVLPVEVAAPRFVRAVEIRFDPPAAVHHATLQVDDSGACRALDARDAEPGFPGMSPGPARPAGDHLIGWTPGKQPEPFVEGTSWRLTPGTDLVLQLHMVPGGRPQAVRASVGLHFTDAAPTRPVYTLVLREDEIDIPAGEGDYVAEESFTLPVGVEAVRIDPHAHYLGREMTIQATASDGAVIPLLRIDAWNFDWQDSYTYARPVKLPAGATLSMRFVYDSSERNARNPHTPPVRVRLGEESSDEMGMFALELLLAAEEDRRRLIEALERRNVERHPDDVLARYSLAIALAQGGRVDEAIAEYREVIRREPRHVPSRINLANLLRLRNLPAEAIALYEETLAIEPDSLYARMNLGTALFEAGEHERGVALLSAAVERHPGRFDACLKLAFAQEQLAQLEAALAMYAKAAAIDAESPLAADGSARVLARLGRHSEAERFARRAVELAPADADLRRRLAALLWELGRFKQSREEWEAVVERAPGDALARRELARALERTGRPDEAAAAYQEALRLAPQDFPALSGLSRVLATHPVAARRRPDLAVKLAEAAARVENADPLQTAECLSTAYAAAGRLADAAAQVERALALLDGATGSRDGALRRQLTERLQRLREALGKARGGR